jgi:hypothetical protein
MNETLVRMYVIELETKKNKKKRFFFVKSRTLNGILILK